MTLHGKPLALFVATIVAVSISFIFVLSRVVSRRIIHVLGWDDLLMAVGTTLFAATSGTVCVGAVAGIGLKNEDLSPGDMITALHAYAIFQPLYVTTFVFIKASISFSLMRVTNGAPKRSAPQAIHACLALSTISGIITLGVFCSQCHPFPAAWTGVGQCKDSLFITTFLYFISIMAIITDLGCTIIPGYMIWNLQMDARKKASLAIILCLGFIPSLATVVRLWHIKTYTSDVNRIHNLFFLVICSIIECALGICAGSVPALKPLVKCVASTFFSKGSQHPINMSSIKVHDSNYQNRTGEDGLKHLLSTRTSLKGQYDLEDCDTESQRHVLGDDVSAVVETSATEVSSTMKTSSIYDLGHSPDSVDNKDLKISVQEMS